MKELFGKSLIKSIISSLVLALAICALVIGIHSTLGVGAVKPLIDNVRACEVKEENCSWNKEEWEESSTENTWEDFDRLNEKYTNGHQAVAMYANKVSNMSSLVWFEFYRNIFVIFVVIGIVGGIILHLFYNKKNSKKGNKK